MLKIKFIAEEALIYETIEKSGKRVDLTETGLLLVDGIKVASRTSDPYGGHWSLPESQDGWYPYVLIEEV